MPNILLWRSFKTYLTSGPVVTLAPVRRTRYDALDGFVGQRDMPRIALDDEGIRHLTPCPLPQNCVGAILSVLFHPRPFLRTQPRFSYVRMPPLTFAILRSS